MGILGRLLLVWSTASSRPARHSSRGSRHDHRGGHRTCASDWSRYPRERGLEASGRGGSANRHRHSRAAWCSATSCDWNSIGHARIVTGYVFLPDGRHLNAETIRQGYEHTYTAFAFRSATSSVNTNERLARRSADSRLSRHADISRSAAMGSSQGPAGDAAE
jgi:hypothetical protein